MNYDGSVPTAKSAKLRRKRCLNDNKLFTPKPNVPDQKFCCDPCRKEFHRHGSAFGPMKAGLYKAIDKKVAGIERDMRRELRLTNVALSLLNGAFKRWREQTALLLVERSQSDAKT